MATVYEIVQGLSQAAANAYDGALDENGEPLLAGLKREEGDPILDRRVMDGFNVRVYGNMMCLSYHSEVKLREVYAPGFEEDIERQLVEIIKFLKKEYKKITGNAITLTKECEADIRVENSTRVRSWVTAKMHYKVGGLNEEMNIDGGSKAPDEYWKSFLSQGGWNGKGGKRPPNDTRKKEKAE